MNPAPPVTNERIGGKITAALAAGHRVGVALDARKRRLLSLEWLRSRSPRVHERVLDWRARRLAGWLRRNAPVEWAALAALELSAPARHRALRELAFGDRAPLRARAVDRQADVVWVASYAYADVVKQAVALKRVDPDLRCILITRGLGSVADLCREWFDEIVLFSDPLDFVAQLRGIRGRSLIVVARGGVQELLVPLVASWRGRFVYAPNTFARAWPVDYIWGHWTKEEAAEAERAAVARADAVIHYHEDAAIERLRQEGLPLPTLVATMYASCVRELGPARVLPKLSARDGELHLVHAAGVGTPKGDSDRQGYAQLWDKWRAMVDSGVHIHAYVPHFDLASPEMAPYKALADESDRFHVEAQRDFSELLVELTQYDYGLQHWDHRRYGVKEEFKHVLSNSFWTLIQAGLPVVTSDHTPGPRGMVERYGIGAVVPEAAVCRTATLLAELDAGALGARVAELRVTEFQLDERKLWRLALGDV